MGDNSVIFHGIAITPKHNPPYPTPSFYGVSITPVSEDNERTNPSPTFIGVSITVPYFISPTFPTPPKKMYITNKGNIMVNPNDTVLIEIN